MVENGGNYVASFTWLTLNWRIPDNANNMQKSDIWQIHFHFHLFRCPSSSIPTLVTGCQNQTILDLPTWPSDLPDLPNLPTWPTHLTYPPDLPIITLRIRTYKLQDPDQDRPRQTRTWREGSFAILAKFLTRRDTCTLSPVLAGIENTRCYKTIQDAGYCSKIKQGKWFLLGFVGFVGVGFGWGWQKNVEFQTLLNRGSITYYPNYFQFCL